MTAACPACPRCGGRLLAGGVGYTLALVHGGTVAGQIAARLCAACSYVELPPVVTVPVPAR